MVCAKILVICSVLMLAFNLIECSKGVKNSKIDVVTVSSVEEFLKENNAKVLYPLTKESMIKGHSPYYYLSYGIGHRVDGDKLLASFWDGQMWNEAKDVTATVKYPKEDGENVETITYVHVGVDQTSVSGQAYVVFGGIGQKTITVVIEAKYTQVFSYTVEFYGL